VTSFQIFGRDLISLAGVFKLFTQLGAGLPGSDLNQLADVDLHEFLN
jgi:hypothetical protein